MIVEAVFWIDEGVESIDGSIYEWIDDVYVCKETVYDRCLCEYRMNEVMPHQNRAIDYTSPSMPCFPSHARNSRMASRMMHGGRQKKHERVMTSQ